MSLSESLLTSGVLKLIPLYIRVPNQSCPLISIVLIRVPPYINFPHQRFLLHKMFPPHINYPPTGLADRSVDALQETLGGTTTIWRGTAQPSTLLDPVL